MGTHSVGELADEPIGQDKVGSATGGNDVNLTSIKLCSWPCE
jgi:hypothetical protein